MKIRGLFLVSATVLALTACSDSKEDSSSSVANRSYQAAGSRWSLTLDDSTFSLYKYASLTATSTITSINGTVAQNSTNLFRTMTVSTASGSDAPSVGATALALEMVGSSTFVVPFGSANPLVATVVSSCPSANFVANWVNTRPSVDSGTGNYVPGNLTSDGAGIATYTASADKFLVQASGITDGVLVAPASGTEFTPFGMSTCSAGRLAVTRASESFDMYFTPSGQILVKFPAANGEQIISGFPQTASTVTAASLDGTYSVFLYRGGNNINLSQESVVAAKLTLTNGTGAIRVITTASTDTEAGSDAFTIGTFSATNDSAGALANGLFRVQLSGGTEGNGNGKLTCATTDGTPRVIACSGFYNTGGNTDNERRPITVLGRIR